MILGIDEVGRGPWAGPLVVGAALLGTEIEGLTDSKKLSAKRREALNVQIHQKAESVALGWVSAKEIDSIGLSEALKLATRRAVRQINQPFHEIIIDGTINLLKGTPLESHVTVMKKADLLIPSVSAAAIVAKVARDSYMAMQDETYPGYGFASHVGYGTASHRLAIDNLGITPLHRLSFAPLKKYSQDVTVGVKSDGVSVVNSGQQAEESAASFLEASGHTVIARNWRTRWCEIDIVSVLNDAIYFTEVKYRKNSKHGNGLDAVTPKKQQQMRFAGELYVKMHNISQPALLAAVSVSGDFTVEQWLQID